MVKSHYPRCLQCFQTQENLTTKTLNPKVTSFVIQVSLSSSYISKYDKNTYIVVFSCQNRVTIGQIVSRLICTTQCTTNLILKACHACQKSCHDWTPRKTCSRQRKIVTRLTNRVTIALFLHITISRQFSTFLHLDFKFVMMSI